MNKIKAAFVALAVIIVSTGCGIKGANSDIIKINNSVITQKDYNKAFDSVSGGMLKTLGIDPVKDPQNIMVLMAKEQVISQLIVSTILNNEIEKSKITVSKEDLDSAEKEITGRFANKEQFLQVLKSGGATYQDFRKNLEQEIKMKKYVDSIAMVSVGEEEAKKYYKENPEKFVYPQEVRASHILISANENAIKAKLKKDSPNMTDDEVNSEVEKQMKEAKQKAEALRKKVTPETFAKIAKDNSNDTVSALKGGDLGFFTKDDMVEEFSKTAFNIKPNTISSLVQTPYGYHIIMVTDRKEAGKYTFEETKKDIITILENQDKMSIFKNKINELGKTAKVEYLDENYNPEIIQKQIKEAAKDNPELQQLLEQSGQASIEG